MENGQSLCVYDPTDECLSPVNTFGSVYHVPLMNGIGPENLLPGVNITYYNPNNPIITWLNFEEDIQSCVTKDKNSNGFKVMDNGRYRLYFNGAITHSYTTFKRPSIGIVFVRFNNVNKTYEVKRNYAYNDDELMLIYNPNLYSFAASIEIDCTVNDVLYIGMYHLESVEDGLIVRLISCDTSYINLPWFVNNLFTQQSGLRNEMTIQPLLTIEKLMDGQCKQNITDELLCGWDTSIMSSYLKNNMISIPFILGQPFENINPHWITFGSTFINACVKNEFNFGMSQFRVSKSGTYNVEFYPTILLQHTENEFIRSTLFIVICVNNESIYISTHAQNHRRAENTNDYIIFTQPFKKALKLKSNDFFSIGVAIGYDSADYQADAFILNGFYDSFANFLPQDRNIIVNDTLVQNCSYNSTLFIIKENNTKSLCCKEKKSAEYTSFQIKKNVDDVNIIPVNEFILPPVPLDPTFFYPVDKSYKSVRSRSNSIQIIKNGNYLIKVFIPTTDLATIVDAIYFFGIIINKNKVISLLPYKTIMAYDLSFEISKYQKLKKGDIIESFIFQIKTDIIIPHTAFVWNGVTEWTVNTSVTNQLKDTISEPLINVYEIKGGCQRSRKSECNDGQHFKSECDLLYTLINI